MNGEGWECDNCGKRELTPAPMSPYYPKYLPKDWFLVVGPSDGATEVALVQPVTHFCSEKCVEDFMYAARNNKVEPTTVTKTGTPVFYSYGAGPSRIAGVLPNDC